MRGEVVSIVIPVYNTEKYLDRCLQSVVAQTYKDLEIILIDDNSQDNSLNTCIRWKKKDDRILVVTKKNEKQGPTRNLGIRIACGKYIMFVDSDDYVAPDYVEMLYNNIRENNSDMAFCDWTEDEFLEDGSLKRIIRKSPLNITGCIDTASNIWLLSAVSFSSCNKIFHLDTLKKANIRQKIDVAEDVCFILEFMFKNMKISQVRKALYHYYQNGSSEVHSETHAILLKNTIKEVNHIIQEMRLDQEALYYVKYYVARIIGLGEYADSRNVKNKNEIADLFQEVFATQNDIAGMNSASMGSYGLRSIVRGFTYFMPDAYSFSSIISIMGQAYDDISFSHKNGFRYDALKKDIKKDFVNGINNYQYLYIDFMEERFDIIKVNDNCFLTASDAYVEAEVSEIGQYSIIKNGSEEYWELWKKSCDALIKLIKHANSIQKVILVKTRLSAWYGEFGPESKFDEYEKIQSFNAMFAKMEEYFISKYEDVATVDFIEDGFYTDSNFLFGCYPWHVNLVWYRKMSNQIYSKLQK